MGNEEKEEKEEKEIMEHLAKLANWLAFEVNESESLLKYLEENEFSSETLDRLSTYLEEREKVQMEAKEAMDQLEAMTGMEPGKTNE